MRMILTVKTGKGKKSTKKEIDQTVEELMRQWELISKSFKWSKSMARCHADGTTLILKQ